MTKKNKGRTKATPKTFRSPHLTVIQAGVKALIVRVALWRVIPARLATWLIQRGGLKDA
jgi:hypothetical protein